MREIIGQFSNRELAFSTWLFLILLLILIDKQYRNSFLNFIKSLFGKYLIKAYLLLGVYLTIQFYVLYRIGIWGIPFLKDTMFWVFSVGFYLIFKSNRITNTKYFKTLVIDGFKITAILEFIVNFASFNFYIELFLSLIILLLILVNFFAGRDPNNQKAFIVSNYLLNSISLIILVFAITYSVYEYQNLLSTNSLKSYLLPIILTILYIPFLYSLAIYNLYQKCFIKFRGITYQKNKVLIARRLIKKNARINLNKLSNIENLFDIKLLHKDIDLNEYIKGISKRK